MSSSVTFKVSQHEMIEAGLDDKLDLSGTHLMEGMGKIINQPQSQEVQDKNIEYLINKEKFANR